jgi:predicted RND superfamily exporter protein
MQTDSNRRGGGKSLAERLEPPVFGHRPLILGLFALLTVFFGWFAVTGLKLDTNFGKQLPGRTSTSRPTSTTARSSAAPTVC